MPTPFTPTVTPRPTRRAVIAAGAGASVAAGLMVHSSRAATAEVRELRLAVVGCGGRGAGAIKDSLSINQGVKLVAAADLYPERCATLRKTLASFGDKIALADDAMHGGLDGHKRVLDDKNVDVVLFATSPGFRPVHLKAAVEAGKHVFAEKPTCVDPVGYRTCLETHDLAVAKGTAIVTGTQYRRQVNYVGAVEQIRRGTIGDIVGATTRVCGTGIWYRPRRPGMSDTEYQLNNWYHFIWLCGDQIVEQAVHNIDLVNWVMGANPVSAFGSGGQFTRPDDSELWDSMSVGYVYPGDRPVSFMCRQIPGAAIDNGTAIHGTNGTCFVESSNGGSRIVDRKGETVWEMAGRIDAAYEREHKDLIDSIRSGKPIVELRQTADSSLVAILGRVAAYTGQRVTFEFLAKESTLDLFPKELAWDNALPKPAVAIPGKTKLV